MQRFGASIELTATSREEVHEGYFQGPMKASIDAEERFGVVPKGSKYEFFDILWVEWVDGVAYGNGQGRIVGSAG